VNAKVAKQRLDVALVERGLVASRSRAQALLLAGEVLVAGQPARGPAQQVTAAQEITLKQADLPFVSRGGVKLAGALDAFGVSPEGLSVLDAGASTGGFTDCLLQRGASRVYAVDVGYGQLAWSLRQDPRVVVMERTNVRHLQPGDLPEPVQMVTSDLAFISLTKVLPALQSLAAPGADFLVLVKPQFELEPSRVGKGGVVRDDADRLEAVERVVQAAASLGLSERGRVDSSLPGPKGNREIVLWLRAEPPAGGHVAPAHDEESSTKA
jgi:23S rRNA (cytidine1920-2'-O)/16S rRNA (cytidine1409-2'-O)-methyltransferase